MYSGRLRLQNVPRKRQNNIEFLTESLLDQVDGQRAGKYRKDNKNAVPS